MNPKKRTHTRVAVLLLAFAIVSAITALVMNANVDRIAHGRLDNTGGLVGPFRIQDDVAVVEIDVRQSPGRQSWSFVTGEVLDANRNYLFAFGGEFWHETGYDSDGYWSETESNYTAKLRLPRGEYFLNIVAENPANGTPGPIVVQVETQLGSSIPFWILTVISLLAGIVYYRRTEATPQEIIDAFRRDADNV